MLSRRIAAKVRTALGIRQWNDHYDAPQHVVARQLGISKRSIVRYEKDGAPEWYRWALIGLMYADDQDPRAVRGLVPERPEALERWRRDMKGAA